MNATKLARLGSKFKQISGLMHRYVQLIFFSLLFFIKSNAQERTLQYNIMHDGEIKGTLLFSQNTIGKTTHIKIESQVNTRFILKINVISSEEAIFTDGILVYSSLRRRVNGTEKVNQQIKAMGVSYKVTSGNKINTLPTYPIHYSILSLYYQEPINFSRVYSDNFQQYVDVIRVSANKYKVNFPNGNYNYYSYKNGICTTVDINQSFYNIQFRLNGSK